jgi:hypothetical protein
MVSDSTRGACPSNDDVVKCCCNDTEGGDLCVTNKTKSNHDDFIIAVGGVLSVAKRGEKIQIS